jgi:zinc protease
MLAPPRSTSDYYILEVLNNVLGGGFSGRLNLNLREDKGYTYGAFSSIRYGLAQSLLLGSAPVESSVTKEAVVEMLEEIDSLHQWRRPVTGDELAHAQENLIRGFAQRFETLSQVAGEVAELLGYAIDPASLAEYTRAIEAVSLDELEAASRRYLDTGQSILVVVGDGARVREGVASLGLGPLVELDSDGETVG